MNDVEGRTNITSSPVPNTTCTHPNTYGHTFTYLENPTPNTNTPNPTPNNKNNTQVQPDELDMIDHVLLSPALAARVASVYMYHGYPEGCDILDSDHWPVVVDFDFGPAAAAAAGVGKEIAV